MTPHHSRVHTPSVDHVVITDNTTAYRRRRLSKWNCWILLSVPIECLKVFSHTYSASNHICNSMRSISSLLKNFLNFTCGKMISAKCSGGNLADIKQGHRTAGFLSDYRWSRKHVDTVLNYPSSTMIAQLKLLHNSITFGCVRCWLCDTELHFHSAFYWVKHYPKCFPLYYHQFMYLWFY